MSRYLVAVASYKRPRELRRLLETLVGATSEHDVDILVVDNDGEGSARPIVDDFCPAVDYVLEPKPGIASARNAGVSRFGDQYEAIVFVDDDEWVDEEWFTAFVNFASASSADVIQGPVISVLAEDAPEWLTKGGFYQRHLPPTGTALKSAATNNTYLKRAAWVAAGSPLFDEGFSTTGGSDWDFFWGLRRAGAKIEFCGAPLVWEEVPESRTSLRWLRRRATRNGIVHMRVRLKHKDRTLVPLLRGQLRMVYYTVQLTISLIAGRGLQAKPFNEIFFEIGKVSGFFGFRIHEYAR